MMQLTKNFNIAEFGCRDGTAVPHKYLPNVQALAENLQIIRDALGEPLHINSAYRTSTYNKKVGGAANSQHLLGKASDLTCKTKRPKELAAIIEKLIAAKKINQGGVGIYPGFVHYDIRGTKARW
jgi:uncharacterized protein YcbK (DUF882 family)